MKNIFKIALLLTLSSTAFAGTSRDMFPDSTLLIDTTNVVAPAAVPAVASDCRSDFLQHMTDTLNVYATVTPATSPMISWCAEPPADYDDCKAAALVAFTVEAQRLADLAEITAQGLVSDALDDYDDAVDSVDPNAGSADEREAKYCLLMQGLTSTFDAKLQAIADLYSTGVGDAVQAYIDDVEKCCNG